jgi:indolepyruvate decarboxylase
VQEIGQFGRFGLKPVVFVLNNAGYLTERLLCKKPAMAYNDVASWRYAELPHALSCDGWFTARATTCGELDTILERAGRSGASTYVEVVTDAYAAPPLMRKLHDAIGTLYKS